MEKNNSIEVKPYINSDYGNEYHFLGVAFRMGGFSAVKDLQSKSGLYKKQPDFYMQTYEERAKIYNYVLFDENKDKIKRINELADKMNKLVKNPEQMDEDNFRKIYDELDNIIRGDKESNLPKK